MDHQRLPDGDHTLLGTRDRALQHEVVVLDDTIVREATHGCNRLLGDIMLGRRVAIILTTADTVDLLVDLRTVVVAVCEARYCQHETSNELESDVL